ncbi:hypothetical protein HHI36_018803 [Cryptolaemus montrouzieri]|uniref:Uncharacterized protein n=1 Tax=Cryptolaemus montrouzieri TaxID=559131 RepID=A0ABD2P1R1_9CUCU
MWTLSVVSSEQFTYFNCCVAIWRALKSNETPGMSMLEVILNHSRSWSFLHVALTSPHSADDCTSCKGRVRLCSTRLVSGEEFARFRFLGIKLFHNFSSLLGV